MIRAPPARVAALAVRFAEVELQPPTSKRKLARVKVWAVLHIRAESKDADAFIFSEPAR